MWFINYYNMYTYIPCLLLSFQLEIQVLEELLLALVVAADVPDCACVELVAQRGVGAGPRLHPQDDPLPVQVLAGQPPAHTHVDTWNVLLLLAPHK